MPWTHLLPPTFPGSVTKPKQQPYRGAPNLRKARQLAAGHLRRGRINIGYRSSGTGGTSQARLLRDNLVKLGVDPARIKLKRSRERTSTTRWGSGTPTWTSASAWAGAATIAGSCVPSSISRSTRRMRSGLAAGSTTASSRLH
jgi:hypothetical protein